MGREVWLRTNRRIWAAIAILLVAVLVSAVSALPFAGSTAISLSLIGIAAFSAGALGWVLWEMRRPRLALESMCLAVYLKGRDPFLVPLESVECFFLGQGPSLFPSGSQQDIETTTLTIRLSESAHDWRHREARPWLGQWCEGYITIRGTFCEPLSREVVGRLNRRLVEVQREMRSKTS